MTYLRLLRNGMRVTPIVLIIHSIRDGGMEGGEFRGCRCRERT
jgi:hypothetical protein